MANPWHTCVSVYSDSERHTFHATLARTRRGLKKGALFLLQRELFHEALWGGQQPGTAIAPRNGRQESVLRKLNHDLIAALLQIRTGYVKEPWWSYSKHLFAVRDA